MARAIFVQIDQVVVDLITYAKALRRFTGSPQRLLLISEIKGQPKGESKQGTRLAAGQSDGSVGQ